MFTFEKMLIAIAYTTCKTYIFKYFISNSFILIINILWFQIHKYFASKNMARADDYYDIHIDINIIGLTRYVNRSSQLTVGRKSTVIKKYS